MVGTECDKCSDYSSLIKELKSKFQVSERSTQVQILTLAPNSWSIEKTAMEFYCSHRIVKIARKLKCESGVLTVPHSKQGHSISAEIVREVELFYQDDEYSRPCPGQKDCLSVCIMGNKVKMNKRLLLLNLKDLYNLYKQQYARKIGLSLFCTLRPKWCITARAHGVHNVCVCIMHQNEKLKLTALQTLINVKLTIKDALGQIVCNTENRECMIQRCDNCPGSNSLREYINDHLNKNSIEYDETIKYHWWIQTDFYLTSSTREKHFQVH